MNLSIPESWQITKLTELAIYVLGGDWGKDVDFESPDYTTALCIRGAEFQNWIEDKGSTASPRKVKKSSLANRVLKDGDILVEISGGGPEQPVGRTVLIDKAALSHVPEVPKICTNFVRLLRTADEIDSRFLNAYLTFFYASGEIRDYQGGSNNLRNLKFNDYIGIDIPIPPLNEQHRIVAKIEELFSELDKGIENLKTAQSQLKVYRQALLKHAFEGKLTAQWRAQRRAKQSVAPAKAGAQTFNDMDSRLRGNDKPLETADTLLKRIQQERAQRYQQQLADWEKSPSIPLLQRGRPTSTAPIPPLEKGGRGGISKPKPPKSLPPLTAEELAELPELPEGWLGARLGLMTCSVEYGTSTKSAESGACPVLRMGNIQNGKFDWTDLVFTDDENEIAKYLLREGDVLFNRTNSPELVGKTAIYRSKHPAIFAGYLIRVNQIATIVESQYLNYFLNSHIAKQHGNTVKTDGVNQSNINGEKLVNYPFPFCSLEEQKVIVELLDAKLSEVDQLDQTITTALQQAEALRQSILKKAFSGQLVPQDPNDEPASALLTRIKAERADTAPKTKRKTT